MTPRGYRLLRNWSGGFAIAFALLGAILFAGARNVSVSGTSSCQGDAFGCAVAGAVMMSMVLTMLAIVSMMLMVLALIALLVAFLLGGASFVAQAQLQVTTSRGSPPEGDAVGPKPRD